MMKKHRKFIPQKRFRQKETTGVREFVNVVYMEKEKILDEETGIEKENLYAVCTCGQWRSEPGPKTIVAVGNEAKAHVDASNGKCRLRPHDLSQKPEYEILGTVDEEEDTDEHTDAL